MSELSEPQCNGDHEGLLTAAGQGHLRPALGQRTGFAGSNSDHGRPSASGGAEIEIKKPCLCVLYNDKKKARMNIRLTPHSKELLEQQLAQGQFRSPEEVT